MTLGLSLRILPTMILAVNPCLCGVVIDVRRERVQSVLMIVADRSTTSRIFLVTRATSQYWGKTDILFEAG